MRLHFPSIAIGVVAVSMILISMSQAPIPVGQPRIEYGPHPRDMVQIKQGSPYVVPAGRLFVLTGIGNADGLGHSSLSVDGVTQLTHYTSCSNGGGPTVGSVPSGFTVAPGSMIELNTHSGSGQARAWGYLANQ